MDPRLTANRDNWNDRTPIHLRSQFYDVDGWLHAPRGPRARERDALGDVTGLRLVHLQCHFGLDTLTFAHVGARVTGLDFSNVAIEAARQLAVRAGLADRADFVCANVYDATAILGEERFDIVYVSLGALCWLPKVDAWAEQVVNLLVTGGRLYLHESHPLAWALDDNTVQVRHTYFEESEPYVDDLAMTYTDGQERLQHTRTYEWNHSLGEILTALAARRMHLDMLIEHDWTVWPRFPWLVRHTDGRWTPPPDVPRVPLTYTVLATKW